MMKSSHLRPIVLSVISTGLIVAFFYYLYVNADKYLELLQVSVPSVAALFILSLAFPVISGISNTHLFRNMGAEINYLDGFFLAAASTLANQLPISGGIISKGFYLKRRYDISYSKFFSATSALFFCFVSVNGMIGISVLLYLNVFQNSPASPVLLTGFSVMATCFLVFWLPLKQVKLPEKIRVWISQFIEGWTLISNNPVLLLNLTGMQVILMLLLALRYWLAFWMLSQHITFAWAILFSVASVLTQLVSIAPGGLGVREAIIAAVASALGLDVGASVVAVGLDRLVSTLGVFIVGGISAAILSKQISGFSVKPDERVV